MTGLSGLIKSEPIQAETGLITRGLNALLGGLGTVGTVLDTPGSVVRGALAGEWDRALGGIFDASERVSGNELIGGEPDEFSWLGLLTEVVTDPTTYLTFGTKTAVGKLAEQAGKTAVRKEVTEQFAKQGVKSSQRRALQEADKLKSVTSKLDELGVEGASRELGKGFAEQARRGQRALITLDIPFSSIQKELVRAPGLSAALGSVADATTSILTQNPVAREIADKFRVSRSDPLQEAARQEERIISKEVAQKARITGKDLAKKRAALMAIDPETDLKVIDLLENYGEELDLDYNKAAMYNDNIALGKLLKAKLGAEELYGQADNFPEVWTFAQQLRALNKDILGNERLAGVAVEGLDSLGYFARVMTPEGAALLRENKSAIKAVTRKLESLDSGTASSFQRRRINNDSLVELNRELSERLGKDPDSFKFFDTDVVSVHVSRFLASSRAIGSAAFSRAAANLFGKEAPPVIKGVKPKKLKGVEEIFARQNGLVTAMKTIIDSDPAEQAKFLAKKKETFKANGQLGVEVGGYLLDDVTEATVEAANKFRRKDKFRALSDNHAAVDDRFNSLVDSGAMKPVHRAFLRTFFAQADPELVGQVAGLSENVKFVDPRHNFLAEFANIYRTTKLDPDQVIAALKEVDPEVTPDNAGDLFASKFVDWVTGSRTPSAILDRLFRSANLQKKAMRDLLEDSSEFSENLSDLFENSTIDNASILNQLPGSDRRTLTAELLDEPHTREAFVEWPADAKPKQIRKALEEAGVTRRFLDDETADFVESVLGKTKYTLGSDKWWAKTIQHIDEIHSLYRTTLTQYFPAFHARNLLSGVFMNAMAGDVKPIHYKKAIDFMLNAEPEDALYLASMNVIDSGKMREVYELMNNSRGAITENMQKLFGLIPGAATAGRAARDATRIAGHAVEDFSRVAHFLAKKEAGFTDLEAAESVTKFLFDYTDLTDFERAVPRRAMLFYTFFRKNIPLMMEQTLKNPRFMVNYARATGQTNPNIQQPEWLPDSFFLGEDEKGNAVRVNFGLPPEDLARFDPKGGGLARAAQLMISNLVPAIKEPFQFVSGRDLFTGRPREGTPGELLAGALPTSRATGTATRLIEALGGDNPDVTVGGELIRFASGVSRRSFDPEVLRKVEELDRIQARLKEIVRQGGGRTIEIVGQRSGREPNPEINALNSLAAKVRAELAKDN